MKHFHSSRIYETQNQHFKTRRVKKKKKKIIHYNLLLSLCPTQCNIDAPIAPLCQCMSPIALIISYPLFWLAKNDHKI